MEELSENLKIKIDNWSNAATSIPAKISNKDRSEPAEVFVKSWSQTERKMRALKSLAILWALALVSILIPIAHFFLVPIFFLAGLIAPSFVYAKSSKILGGFGKCPHCGKEFEIAEANNLWPLNDICSICNRHVKIEKSIS